MKFGGPIDMLHGSLWDKVLAFTLPLVATALLQQLYNGADWDNLWANRPWRP